jgi:hypothetical protein
MSKAEQLRDLPFVTEILVLSDISLPLLAAHIIPNRSILLVPPHVVVLAHNKHEHTPNRKSNQHLVTGAIQWLVILSIDLGPSIS